MSAPKTRDPMGAWDGFIFGFLLLLAAAMLLNRQWGDALDGFIIAGLVFGWSSASRRVSFLERAIRESRRTFR